MEVPAVPFGYLTFVCDHITVFPLVVTVLFESGKAGRPGAARHGEAVERTF